MTACPPPTARLAFRPFVADDAPSYAALRFHREVVPWLPAPQQDDLVAEARRVIAAYAEDRAARGHGIDACIERATARLAGYCGLRLLPAIGAVDILWTFDPAVQGRGYAKEAARAQLDFGFDTLGLDKAGAVIRPDNLRSQAVARALGMEWLREIEPWPGQIRGWWEIRADTWRRLRGG